MSTSTPVQHEEHDVLSLLGGFDAVQLKIRSAAMERLQEMKLGDLQKVDAQLSPEDKHGALSQGLIGLGTGTNTKPITSRNLEVLELLLQFAVTDIFRNELAQHLQHGKPGDPIPGLVMNREGTGLHPRSGDFVEMISLLRHQIDAAISPQGSPEDRGSAEA